MAQSTVTQSVSTEWVEKFVDRWVAAVNSRRPDRVLELMTGDIVYDDSGSAQTMRGHIEVREFLNLMWRAFPDITFERVGAPMVASDGAGAAFRWRAHATFTGPIDPPGIPPTGKRVDKWEGADFLEYRDGKIARLWILFDMADVLRQMGLLPQNGSAAARAMVWMQRLRRRLRL